MIEKVATTGVDWFDCASTGAASVRVTAAVVDFEKGS